MKVLFAVSNEEISESIIKKYQKEYKEIISYKNVYYFNAILKELQKDKSYDRIVIGEDLEAFSNTQYSQIDKFIFDKLDSISDEASNLKGDNIPIILIASDRRQKSEEMLVKLFGIGIYDVLLGNDRSVNNVCLLLNKSRTKKEAKIYYQIEADDVMYQSEDENDVSEIEIQNILAHYKRLGKNEEKYVESFDNIAAQYNNVQLRIISKFLPLNVKAVLEEKSKKYQEVISYNNKVSNSLRSQNEKTEKKSGTSEKLLNGINNEKILSKPVVIPSAVNMNSTKKLSKVKEQAKPIEPVVEDSTIEKSQTTELQEIESLLEGMQSSEQSKKEPIEQPIEELVTEEPIIEGLDNIEKTPEVLEEEPVAEEPKRGRGRPRKYPLPDPNAPVLPKRGRGRPRKNPVVEELDEEESTVLPGFTELDEVEEDNTVLPGLDEIETIEEDNTVLPGLDELEEKDDKLDLQTIGEPAISEQNSLQNIKPQYDYEDVDISSILTSDKKVACFVGTSKNGTSFIVNNLAQIAAAKGIDTAILDTTKNRNAYYIYTQNDENLRKVAMSSINNLLVGRAEGIQVNRNLTVYTSLPEETEGIENAGMILQTLLKKHSLVLIDCDFDTPISYFAKTQEIYLVQTLDILTIQPLTAFLRELKSKGVLEQSKLKVILNKTVKLRGINEQVIIGGMAYYNDPSMSFMTELFNKNTIRYISIPFDEDVYAKYLEGIVNCEISIKGYPKNIVQILQELSNIVYPLLSNKPKYTPPTPERSTFTPGINSTLDEMKRRY